MKQDSTLSLEEEREKKLPKKRGSIQDPYAGTHPSVKFDGIEVLNRLAAPRI
jgi:hypothetical protein